MKFYLTKEWSEHGLVVCDGTISESGKTAVVDRRFDAITGFCTHFRTGEFTTDLEAAKRAVIAALEANIAYHQREMVALEKLLEERHQTIEATRLLTEQAPVWTRTKPGR